MQSVPILKKNKRHQHQNLFFEIEYSVYIVIGMRGSKIKQLETYSFENILEGFTVMRTERESPQCQACWTWTVQVQSLYEKYVGQDYVLLQIEVKKHKQRSQIKMNFGVPLAALLSYQQVQYHFFDKRLCRQQLDFDMLPLTVALKE